MDDGKPSLEGKFSDVDERNIALLSVVEDQQTAVRAGIQGMAIERVKLHTVRASPRRSTASMPPTRSSMTTALCAKTLNGAWRERSFLHLRRDHPRRRS
jgi:hypothetical protein